MKNEGTMTKEQDKERSSRQDVIQRSHRECATNGASFPLYNLMLVDFLLKEQESTGSDSSSSGEERCNNAGTAGLGSGGGGRGGGGSGGGSVDGETARVGVVVVIKDNLEREVTIGAIGAGDDPVVVALRLAAVNGGNLNEEEGVVGVGRVHELDGDLGGGGRGVGRGGNASHRPGEGSVLADGVGETISDGVGEVGVVGGLGRDRGNEGQGSDGGGLDEHFRVGWDEGWMKLMREERKKRRGEREKSRIISGCEDRARGREGAK